MAEEIRWILQKSERTQRWQQSQRCMLSSASPQALRSAALSSAHPRPDSKALSRNSTVLSVRAQVLEVTNDYPA